MGKIPRGQGPVRFCEMRKDEGLWLRVGAALKSGGWSNVWEELGARRWQRVQG